MALAYFASFGLVTVYWLLKINGALNLSLFSRRRAGPILEYGSYYFGAGIGSFLVFNVQSLILNTRLSPKEVGVYAAYYTATIGVAGYLGYAANTVLFPKAAASTNRRRLWDMAATSWKRLFPVAAALLLCAETAILALMGRHQYGMDPVLMLLFAACGTLILIQSSMSQILFSESIKTSRLALFMSLGSGLFNFGACLVLIPLLKTAGLAVAMIITYSLNLVWLWRSADTHLGRPAAND
jgi:O-antigen/teichoic acid export membrane protein